MSASGVYIEAALCHNRWLGVIKNTSDDSLHTALATAPPPAARLYELASLARATRSPGRRTVKPDDHSEVVPLLPIPNRTVKRLSADDSADSRVKVGHRQAINCKALVTA